MERCDAEPGDKEHHGQRYVCGGPSEEAHHGACDARGEDDDPSKCGSVGEVTDERLKQGRELKECCERPRRGIREREIRNEVWEKWGEEGGVRVVNGMGTGDCDDVACLELVGRYGVCVDAGVSVGQK